MDRNACIAGRRVSPGLVALRKESVDRNATLGIFVQPPYSRSPQGERG